MGGINGGDGEVDIGLGGELVGAQDGAEEVGARDTVGVAVAIEPGEDLLLEGKAGFFVGLTALGEDLIEEGGGVGHGDVLISVRAWVRMAA